MAVLTVPCHTMRAGIALKNITIPFEKGDWSAYHEIDSGEMRGAERIKIVSGLEYPLLVVDSINSKFVWVLFHGGEKDRRVLLPRSWFAID